MLLNNHCATYFSILYASLLCTAIIMCSPLKPASNLLRLLRLIGGFPLMAKDSSWTSFEFCKCYTIYHVLTYGIHGIPLAIYL